MWTLQSLCWCTFRPSRLVTLPPELFQMARRTPARLQSGIAARPALTHWVWHIARSQDAKEQLLEVISLLWTSCTLTKLGLYLNLWAEDSLKGFIPYNMHWQRAILTLTANLWLWGFSWKVLYRPVVNILNLQLDIQHSRCTLLLYFPAKKKNCRKPKVTVSGYLLWRLNLHSKDTSEHVLCRLSFFKIGSPSVVSGKWVEDEDWEQK